MGAKVLVVDDELDMRIYVTTLLETSGFKPLSAENGDEGFLIARRERPSLIILDVMMPKESGINMYRELKNDPELSEVPVIILSGLAEKTFFHSQKMLDRYREEKIPEPEAYIEKPAEPEELLNVIKACIK